MDIRLFEKSSRLLLEVFFLLCISFTISAGTVDITWKWTVNDPAVTTFRYQVDGEEPENWNYVDRSVLSHAIRGVDGNVDHVLFLQQSYDGLLWSESAVASSLVVKGADTSVPTLFVGEDAATLGIHTNSAGKDNEKQISMEVPAEDVAQRFRVSLELTGDIPMEILDVRMDPTYIDADGVLIKDVHVDVLVDDLSMRNRVMDFGI